MCLLNVFGESVLREKEAWIRYTEESEAWMPKAGGVDSTHEPNALRRRVWRL